MFAQWLRCKYGSAGDVFITALGLLLILGRIHFRGLWAFVFAGDPAPLWDPPGGDSATPRRSGGVRPKWGLSIHYESHNGTRSAMDHHNILLNRI